MSAQKHILFWLAVFAVFVGFVFVFKSILLPFVLGMAVAYLLNPVVNKISPDGKRRSIAAILILLLFVALVFAFIAALLPVLHKQILDLSEALPRVLEELFVLVEPYIAQVQNSFNVHSEEDLKALIGQNAAAGLNVAEYIFSGFSAGGQAVFDLLSLIFLMPIVAYFMMKEWPKILNWGESLMPEHSKITIKDLLKQIDQKISGFVRGQISVAVILALIYAVALSIAGLNYGLLIGVIAGLLSVIPMVGSLVGLVVAVAVAWFQAGEWTFVALVAAIFFAGQIIEGNFLTPKLVGDSVGLHPLWVFFALLAGGSLFGILGMFLAVPVAAVAGVLIAFGLTQYKTSVYFKGAKTKKPQVKSSAKKKSVKKKVKNAG